MMQGFKIHSAYVQKNKMFYFMFLSSLIHAIFFVRFIFSSPIVYAVAPQKRLFVQIVDSTARDNSIESGKKAGKMGIHEREVDRKSSQVANKVDFHDVPETREEMILSINKESVISKPVEGSHVETSTDDGLATESLVGFGYPEEKGGSQDSEVTSGEGIERGRSVGSKGVSSDSDGLPYDSEGLNAMVFEKVRRHTKYPLKARKLGLEGKVQLSFRLLSDGSVHDVSANGKMEDLTILEKAALESVHDASPFDSLPSEMPSDGVSIRVVISYQLSGERERGGE